MPGRGVDCMTGLFVSSGFPGETRFAVIARCHKRSITRGFRERGGDVMVLCLWGCGLWGRVRREWKSDFVIVLRRSKQKCRELWPTSKALAAHFIMKDWDFGGMMIVKKFGMWLSLILTSNKVSQVIPHDLGGELVRVGTYPSWR